MKNLSRVLFQYRSNEDIESDKIEYIRRNNLIAVYMGYKKRIFNPNNKNAISWIKNKDTFYYDYDFHKNWSRLMDVVSKISSIDCSNIEISAGIGCTDSFYSCKIKVWLEDRKFETSQEVLDGEYDLITSVYNSVSEYVEWYLAPSMILDKNNCGKFYRCKKCLDRTDCRLIFR